MLVVGAVLGFLVVPSCLEAAGPGRYRDSGHTKRAFKRRDGRG